jgi:RNA polymerase sigma-70 factor (ECF subfamily)
LTELVDPLDGDEWIVDAEHVSAENALVLRDDVRYAVVVALQCLSAKQRAAIVLRDVCGLSLAEIADTLQSNENAVKALLQRGRVALAEARGPSDVDVPPSAEVVERFARAVQAGSIEDITALLARDVWGIVDGGGVVVTANKPTFGVRTVARQWANAKTKLGVPVLADVVRVNGEPAVLVRLQGMPEVVVALVHLETRAGRVVAQRVLRDPVRLSRFGAQAAARA